MGLPIDQNAPVFDKKGRVKVEEMSRILGFHGQLKFIEINTHISERTLKRPKQTAKTVQALSPMLHLTNLCWNIFEGNKSKISEFIHTPRTEWKGFSPAGLLMLGKHQGIVDFLERWMIGSEGIGG